MTSPKDTVTDKLLRQAISHLQLLINKEKDKDTFLHSPTNDIKECCAQSALKCFWDGLNSTSQKNQVKGKLLRNLRKPSIMNSMNTCSEEEIQNVQCPPCDSYPMVSSKQFLIDLQSHLQKAYSRLP